MKVDVHLRSGLVLRDAARMLVEKFRQWPWDRYDGDPPRDPNVIDIGPDVDRVYRLGARTPRQAYVDLIQTHGEKVSACFQGIPAAVALEDADLASLRNPIVDLFNTVCCKHVRMAGATKLIYPFRPSLLPVIDSFVDRYYWYATSLRDESTFRRLGQIEGWGEYIFELLCLMQADVDAARNELDQALAACSGYDFAKASRVRVLESLIWHYYARAGTAGSNTAE